MCSVNIKWVSAILWVAYRFGVVVCLSRDELRAGAAHRRSAPVHGTKRVQCTCRWIFRGHSRVAVSQTTLALYFVDGRSLARKTGGPWSFVVEPAAFPVGSASGSMSSSSSLSRGTDSSSFDEGVFGDFNSTEVLELLYVAVRRSCKRKASTRHSVAARSYDASCVRRSSSYSLYSTALN